MINTDSENYYYMYYLYAVILIYIAKLGRKNRQYMLASILAGIIYGLYAFFFNWKDAPLSDTDSFMNVIYWKLYIILISVVACGFIYIVFFSNIEGLIYILYIAGIFCLFHLYYSSIFRPFWSNFANDFYVFDKELARSFNIKNCDRFSHYINDVIVDFFEDTLKFDRKFVSDFISLIVVIIGFVLVMSLFFLLVLLPVLGIADLIN